MKMLPQLIAAFAFFLSFPAWAEQTINADFIDTKGSAIGTATMQEMKSGILLTIDINLPAGTHGMHIHEKPACDLPDFKSSGGHFNPDGHKHGFDSTEGFHAGDLPNLYVEATGHIKTDIFLPHMHLSGKDGLGNGAALVVHDKDDDYTSDPAGNAGVRIACALLKE